MRRPVTTPAVRPRRRRRRWAVPAGIIVVILALLVGIWLGGHPSTLPALLRGRLFERRRPEAVTEQALNILTTRYFRPLSRSQLVDEGLAAMVTGLDDPYSHYIDPSAYQASHEPREPLVGIGIQVTSKPEGLRVDNVFDDSPAARAGLARGDLIVKVDSTSLADRTDGSGTDLIRGPAGTKVTLTVRRDGAEREVSVEREKIVVPIITARMLTDHGVHIGYLRLTEFAADSGDELRTATQKLLHEGAQALILDLRHNGGGLISEAVTVASIFLAHGTVLSAEERSQPRRVYEAHGDAVAAHDPLVVLVDHGTASSSEIVTAALQDHGRAKVVGTPTFGKGVFQLTLPLVNGGALDLTIGQFFTPDGRNLGDGTHPGEGIVPNIRAPDSASDPEHDALAVAERTVAGEVQGKH